MSNCDLGLARELEAHRIGGGVMGTELKRTPRKPGTYPTETPAQEARRQAELRNFRTQIVREKLRQAVYFLYLATSSPIRAIGRGIENLAYSIVESFVNPDNDFRGDKSIPPYKG